MKRGGLAVLAGHGRIIHIGGFDDSAEVVEHTVAVGVYSYPNGDPRHDRVWCDLHGHDRVFKDEFLEADRKLGLHTHSGGAAFIALAKYLVAKEKGDQAARNLRVSLLRENLSHSGVVYAIGVQVVADVVAAIDNGSITVLYLMSPARMEVLRAILAGEADEKEATSVAEQLLELVAAGFEYEEKSLMAGERVVYRALNSTRFLITNGSLIAKIGTHEMFLYREAEMCEIDQWDTVEFVAGENGVTYMHAVRR